MEILSKVNEIIVLAEVGIRPDEQSGRSKFFGMGPSSISFSGENLDKYYAALLAAYSENKEVEKSYTPKTFESRLIDCFRPIILQDSHASANDVKQFIASLLSAPLKEFSVSREIFGIKVDNLNAPVKLGGFTVHSPTSHPELIQSRRRFLDADDDDLWLGHEPSYLIEWRAHAREQAKAVAHADRQFEVFENFLRFMLGISSRFEVGVLNYQGLRRARAYVYSTDGAAGTSASNHGAFEDLPICDPWLTNQNNGNQYAWCLTSLLSPNKFQQRLRLAIEWIGQAISEAAPQSSFLKAAISLEIIFTHNEKSIINPSILSQISEGSALLLGSNVHERLHLEKEAKRLYSLRSSIVHSGNTHISNSDRKKMISLASSVARKLLICEELKQLASVEQLYQLTKEAKYSCRAF
ncbi:hypothetical protein EVJ50_01940 [Synechococcus sp. RSCCF101]|uniref:HEPN domain-containing protein n=1 Tax=Synechococcus sp. RSCCF101 TaxID=2511069 RepID=UPI001243E634|nr:HEPN domain-containing protein [Synechococcus sp. RSCCF101]QEY31193.1 hypothetical protein EVJ50_01940 [Synechococcus sp. RSCCF101]